MKKVEFSHEAEVYYKELEEWKNEIKKAFNTIIINVLKNSYPYIVDIADIRIDHIFHELEELPVKVVLFMKPDYINKNHEKIDREIKTFLEMLQLDKRQLSYGGPINISLRVYLVESE